MLPTRKTRGFTLIATLMLLLIMSGIAIGLLMIWAVRPSITRDLWPACTTPLTLREGTRTTATLPTILRLETTSSIISSGSHKTCRQERHCSVTSTT